MPSINTGEADFMAVAGAALDAKNSGNLEAAQTLDKLARKINAALSTSNPTLVALLRASGLPPLVSMTWRDMPSVIGSPMPNDLATPTSAKKVADLPDPGPSEEASHGE